MINAEVEPLGGFIAEAFALPAFQGGTLVTILVFMFMQDPIMGLAAIALYPIPDVRHSQTAAPGEPARQAAGAAGAPPRRSHRGDGRRRTRHPRQRHDPVRACALHPRARVVFNVRYQIYKKKFFIKFLNNFMAQLGPFFFSIGGYLVIMGDLTLGALVAVVGAHEKLYSPWKELLNHYQLTWDLQIKFEQVVAQFDPARAAR